MVPMGGKNWPPAVPVLTPAQLPDGSVVNLVARSEGGIIYVTAIYPSPGAAPCLSYGRVKPGSLLPLEPSPEGVRSSP